MAANPLQEAYARVLLRHISKDMYPSSTHMDMLEGIAPPEVRVEYTMHLLDRISSEPHPSIPMLQRVERLVSRWPLEL